MKRYIVPIAIGGWWCGIILHHLSILIPLAIIWIILILCIVIASVTLFTEKRITTLILLALFMVSSMGAYIRSTHQQAPQYDPILDSYIDTQATLSGYIRSHPEIRERDQRFILETDHTIPSKVLVTTTTHESLRPGMYITATGRLRIPEAFITDTGRIFHYDRFLAKDDIYFTMSFAHIENVSESSLPPIAHSAWHSKQHLLSVLDRTYSSPGSELLGGMLLGERSRLSDSIQEQFRIAGVVHIIVLSGFHVTIVSLSVFWILRSFLPQKTALILSIAGILFFIAMVGATSTIIRASSMAIVAILARIFGQSHNGLRGLMMVGGGMTMHNTRILLWDTSFQLSFLATLGLIIFADPIEKYLKQFHMPALLGIRETLVATISAQIMVTPLILYSMGTFSIIAPLANILIVPWTIFIMIGGGVSLIIGGSIPFIGLLVAIPVQVLLSLQLFLADKLSSLSFASITLPPIPLWGIMGIYAIIGAIAYQIYTKNLYTP